MLNYDTSILTICLISTLPCTGWAEPNMQRIKHSVYEAANLAPWQLRTLGDVDSVEGEQISNSNAVAL